MKLVELLADKLDNWADTTVCYIQDPCGTIYPCTSIPEFNVQWYGIVGFIDQNDEAISTMLEISSDYSKAIIRKAQWQAERDRQKGGEWKRHRGGKQPVADDVVVECKLRNGYTDTWHARALSWSHAGGEGDVMKYRVISQPQAEELEYRGPFPCAPIGETVNAMEFEIEFPSGACIVEAKTEQMETPFKWRDEVTELNAYIEKFTRERDELIDRLASEGFALIPPVVSVVSEFSGIDMSDWRNWKAGDVVECRYSDCDNVYTVGNRYDVDHVTSTYARVSDDCGRGGFCHIGDADSVSVRFKLIQ